MVWRNAVVRRVMNNVVKRWQRFTGRALDGSARHGNRQNVSAGESNRGLVTIA